MSKTDKIIPALVSPDKIQYEDKSENEEESVKPMDDNAEESTNQVIASVNKENVTNGDLHQEKDDKDSKEFVLSTVDMNIKDKENDENEKELNPKIETDENCKSNLLDDDDNAVDIDVKETQPSSHFKEEVENDPNFAVICSFLQQFGEALEIGFSIRQLKLMFEDYSKVRPDLIDLHIKLLRKRRKYINKEKWEIALSRFCAEYSNADAWELERFGYKNAKLSLRLRIFVRLLEAMFDHNQKFKSELNAGTEAAKLRVQSCGRDISGFNYWYQIDTDLNFRLYKEEPDEDGSWSLVSKTLPELNDCIQELSTKSIADIKLESSSNSDESNSNQAMLLLLSSEKFEQAEPEIKAEDEEEEETEMHIDEETDEKPNDATIVNNDAEDVLLVDSQVLMTEIKETETSKEKKSRIKSAEMAKSPLEIQTIDNEVVDVELESKTTTDEQLTNVQSNLSDIDLEVKSFCDDLLNKVAEDEGEEEHENTPKKRKTRTTSRGWGRGRRRGRSQKAKKGQTKKTTSNAEENERDEEHEEEDENLNEHQNDENDTNKQVAEEEEEPNNEPKLAKSAGRKRKTELDKLKEDFTDDMSARRFSRRVQILHQKKQQEMEEEQKRLQKELEEKRRKKAASDAAKTAAMVAIAMRNEQSNDSADRKGRRRRKKKVESEEEDFQKESSDEEEEEDLPGKKKKRRRRGKGKRRRGYNPWEDSDDSEEEVLHYEDEYDDVLEDDEVLRFDDNDNDEFACEEIDPNEAPVIVRRARTVKKSKDDLIDGEEPVVNDDKPCGRCGKYDNPQWILLCDKCDDGYHSACLRPPLFIIPTGEWFCPPCEHKQLIGKLNEEYTRLNEEFEKREAEKIAKRKRWKFGHCAITSDNILGEEEEETQLNENGEPVDKFKKVAKIRPVARKPRKRQNGFIRDELNDAFDDFENSSEEEEEDIEGDDDDGSSESDEDSRSSNSSEESSSSNSSEEDELGKLAFDSPSNEKKKKKKNKKEKRVDINDYSRSGLKLRSARKRKPINYLFKEYDNLIKSAIMDVDEEEEVVEAEEETDASGGLPRSKGKDISNILRANSEMPDFTINPFDVNKENNQEQQIVTNTALTQSKENTTSQNNGDEPTSKTKTETEADVDEEDEKNPDEDEEENVEDEEGEESIGIKKRRPSNSNKKKKLTNLDFSTDEDDGGDHASDEDFRMGEDDDEASDDLTEVEDENDDDNTPVSDSDSDIVIASRRRSSRVRQVPSRYGARNRKKKKKKSKKSKKKSSKRSRARRYSDSEEEEETTEEDDEEMSDMSSDFEPQARRRATTKRITYREESSTEGEDEAPKRKKKKDIDSEEEEEADEEIDEEEDDYLKPIKPMIKSAPLKTYSKKASTKIKKKKRMIDDDDDDEEEVLPESGRSKRSKTNADTDATSSAASEKPLAETTEVISESESVAKQEPKPSNTSENQITPLSSASTTLPISTQSTSSNDSFATQPLVPTSSYSEPKAPQIDPLSSIKQMNSKLDYPVPLPAPGVSTPSPTSVHSTRHPMTSPYPNMPPYAGPLPGHYQHPYHPPPPGQTGQIPHQYPPNAPYPPPSSTHHYPLPHHQFVSPPMSGHRVPGPPPAGPYGPPHQPHPSQYAPRHSIPNSSPYSIPYPPPPMHPQHYSRPAAPPPQSTIGSSVARSEEKGEEYVLTNLDSFGSSRPTPVKPSTESPSAYNSNFSSPSQQPPTSSSPPQLLNLDSGTTTAPAYSRPYPPPPHHKPQYYPGHPHVPPPGFDPGNRMTAPPPNYPYPPHSSPGQPFYPPGPGVPPQHLHQPPHHMPYGPPPNAGPYHQTPPPGAPHHYMQRTPSPNQRSPSSSPFPPPNSTAVTNAAQSAPSQAPLGPYPPGAPPPQGYPPYQYPMQGQPSGPPPPYQAGPNGGFMIQNLLLNRAPAPSPVCAVKSAPKVGAKTSSKGQKGAKATKESVEMKPTETEPVAPDAVAASSKGGKAKQAKPRASKKPNKAAKDTGEQVAATPKE